MCLCGGSNRPYPVVEDPATGSSWNLCKECIIAWVLWHHDAACLGGPFDHVLVDTPAMPHVPCEVLPQTGRQSALLWYNTEAFYLWLQTLEQVHST